MGEEQKKELVQLCVDGLRSESSEHKQYYLEEILSKLVSSSREFDKIYGDYLWDEPVTPW